MGNRRPSRTPNTQSKPPSSHKTKKPTDQTTGSHKGHQQQQQLLLPPPKLLTYTLPPLNWPSTLPYLASNHVSAQLEPEQLSLLSPAAVTASLSIPTLATYAPTRNPLVQIKQIADPAHPVYPQHGLFATRYIPAGTHIIDYTGLVHVCPQAECAMSDYDLAFLDRDAGLAIDGALMGNEGRFVNDWHGVREEGPNAVFEEYFVKAKDKGKEVWQARMGIWAKPVSSTERSVSGIAKGSEICVGYGKGWWRARRGLMELVEEKSEADLVIEDAGTSMQET